MVNKGLSKSDTKKEQWKRDLNSNRELSNTLPFSNFPRISSINDLPDDSSNRLFDTPDSKNYAKTPMNNFKELSDVETTNSQQSNPPAADQNFMEIDVRPRQRVFRTQEERTSFKENYTRKKKTELCKNWALKGNCRYGDSCSFAHGNYELKPKDELRPKNYKTRPCEMFHNKHICNYGNRCHYLHNERREMDWRSMWDTLNQKLEDLATFPYEMTYNIDKYIENPRRLQIFRSIGDQ